MDLVEYLMTIHERIKKAYEEGSIEQFLDVANEVGCYQPEVDDNGVARLNVLKTFLVATKNHPDKECLAIRTKIKEEYYEPLSLEKYGKVY
jgi:hypothetical protein